MAHFLVSAAHKSSGKTTLSIGLTAALRGRGRTVQPFKKGPDYIDPLWLTSAAGRPCINLDFYTTPDDEIRREFHRAMNGADVGLVEGNMGLFDGLDLEGSNSNAALAKLIGAPVVLVLDARGMTRGAAPLLLGYQAFDPGLRLAGVVLNKVAGARHEQKLRQVIEHYTDIELLGAVRLDGSLEIDERHLGLMPSNESTEAQAKIERLGAAVAGQVDLDRLLEIAAQAPGIPAVDPPPPPLLPPGGRVRIGYPRDRAFGFYYPGDLEKMARAGAELVPFDALEDPGLPEVDGLFIGGGFPETAMEALEANAAMRRAIREFIENGGPVYAECGGLMYLARSLTWKGKSCKMVGVIQGDAVMYSKPKGRGYVRLLGTGASPWPADRGVAREIPGHEFHYSAIEGLGADTVYAYEVKRGSGIDGVHDGIVYKNLLASYAHLRDVGGNDWTRRFIGHVAHCKADHARRADR
jgi:cobyrinic acid a,c-diamide synthase